MHRKLMDALARLPAAFSLKDRLQNVGKPRDVQAALAAALEVAPRRPCARASTTCEHHQAHMASAFFVSPFERAALLSVDGFGDFVSTMVGSGEGSRLEVLDWVEYPHSLGILVHRYLPIPRLPEVRGRREGNGAGALRSAALPRSVPRDPPPAAGGEVRAGSGLFHAPPPWGRDELGVRHPHDQRHFLRAVRRCLRAGALSGNSLTSHHQDVAASLQARLEEALFHVLNSLHGRLHLQGRHNGGEIPLCLAGGVALNCTANGKIRQSTPFRDIYIQPAAGDDGTAIGAAYFVHHQETGADCHPTSNSRRRFVMRHAYTGPSFADREIEAALKARGLRFRSCGSPGEAAREAAALIAGGEVVGWFQGAMEYGPRALGHRSIVADPRRGDMKQILNARIKYREAFRPFAPSVLAERAGDWFEEISPSPFMQMVFRVRPERRGQIPAVTHVDGTARLQTVDSETSPLYWRLIHEFERLTEVPMLLNTSFNENEPIVCTPGDAIDCYRKTAMDALVIGSFLVRREDGRVASDLAS